MPDEQEKDEFFYCYDRIGDQNFKTLPEMAHRIQQKFKLIWKINKKHNGGRQNYEAFCREVAETLGLGYADADKMIEFSYRPENRY